MLNSLRSMLFASGTAEDAAVDQTQASQPVELDTEEGEMGWLLVDVPGSSAQARVSGMQERPVHDHDASISVKDTAGFPGSEGEESSTSSERVVEEEDWVCGEALPLHPPLCPEDLSTSQCVVSGYLGLLGESWIMAPLPCFTGTASLNQLQSNPLEDLLIEHPSMSVYGMRSLSSPERQESGAEKENMSERRAVVSSDNHAVERQHPQRVRAVRACAVALQQTKRARHQQRQQKAAADCRLSRSYIDRSNKALMVQSSCRKQLSARSRVLRPSGCMNGRRSQRAH